MSPESFVFKLTVPNDPAGADVVAIVATHAVRYAQIEAGKAEAFVGRVKALALTALASGAGGHTPAQFAAADGRLTVTIGGHTESESLPA